MYKPTLDGFSDSGRVGIWLVNQIWPIVRLHRQKCRICGAHTKYGNLFLKLALHYDGSLVSPVGPHLTLRRACFHRL